MRPCLRAGLIWGSIWSLAAGPAAAQSLELGGDEPIEIESAESLEWHSEEKVYVARGDARLKQGDVEVRAEVLSAHYRELADGGTEIWRVTADGDVVVQSADERAQGDEGYYDLEQDVFVLTGSDLKLETPAETVTARDSLEYWRGTQTVVARGDAMATRPNETGGQDQIEADVLTAQFAENAQGDLAINEVNAVGNVVITTPTDVVRGREGVYDVVAKVATLTGDVRLTRGSNQLNGDRAVVDLQTGLSRLLAQPGADGDGGRVRGLLVPED